MGLTVRLESRSSYVLRREREYLAADVKVLTEAVRKRVSRASAWVRQPFVRSWFGMASGVVVAVVGLAIWSLTVALVVLGVALVVYGALLVDLDPAPGRQGVIRRRR